MVIHYTRAGGWVDTAELDVYGTGLVQAHRLAHASLDTLNDASTCLCPADRERVAELFHGFSGYDRSYEPARWHADASQHRIILVYDGKADTVHVYDPDRAELPGRLHQIIRQMDSLWLDTLYPED